VKALDLFCGLGGWSDGLAAEGFDVTGVEIEPKIAALYKHPVIVSDVCDLNPEDFKGYDLIVGSPPCRDFCIMAKTLGHRWKVPPDPEGEGLRLVKAFLNFVEIAKPRYWLLENTSLLEQHLKIKPRQKTSLGIGMLRGFWGNYPSFLVPRDYRHDFKFGERKPLTPWERAKIPLPVAKALGEAVVSQLHLKNEVIK
jgi:site-specific DNA-cytosine methylase